MRHEDLAESLGLALARRACDILDRHRAALTSSAPDDPVDPAQFATDDAIFTAVLDAASDCLARADPSSSEDRWCDALLYVLLLAQLAPDTP